MGYTRKHPQHHHLPPQREKEKGEGKERGGESSSKTAREVRCVPMGTRNSPIVSLGELKAQRAIYKDTFPSNQMMQRYYVDILQRHEALLIGA